MYVDMAQTFLEGCHNLEDLPIRELKKMWTKFARLFENIAKSIAE